MNNHLKGFSITALGVLILSSDSLLIRLVYADSLVVGFWRGLFSGLVVIVFLLLTRPQFLLSYLRRMRFFDCYAILFFIGGNMSFVYSIGHTQVVHALIITALTPLFASLFSWWFLHESITKQTALTIIAAFVGILIMTYGDARNLELSQDTLMGDLAALMSVICFSAILTMVRARQTFEPIVSLALSGFAIALIGVFFAGSVSIPNESWVPILIMGLFVVPFSLALIMTGPKYITPSEVGLLMLLETVVGPLLVWWYLHEEPSIFALIGGGIILGALIALNSYQLLKHRAQ